MTRTRSRSRSRSRSSSRSRVGSDAEHTSSENGDDEHEDEDESPLEEIVAGLTIGLILTVAFGLLAMGVSWFWIVFPIGFAGVLPAVLGLTKLYERRRSSSSVESDTRTAGETGALDALETLRERYARGELTDEEFERRLERLVATETLEDVERDVRTRDRDRDRDRPHDREYRETDDRDETLELE